MGVFKNFFVETEILMAYNNYYKLFYMRSEYQNYGPYKGRRNYPISNSNDLFYKICNDHPTYLILEFYDCSYSTKIKNTYPSCIFVLSNSIIKFFDILL